MFIVNVTAAVAHWPGYKLTVYMYCTVTTICSAKLLVTVGKVSAATYLSAWLTVYSIQ
jgi:hypothetical protein